MVKKLFPYLLIILIGCAGGQELQTADQDFATGAVSKISDGDSIRLRHAIRYIGVDTADRNFLLIAEALFMYLPKDDVINLFRIFSERFYNSQIALEVATEKYTRGVWKKIVEMKIKRQLGFGAGLHIISV